MNIAIIRDGLIPFEDLKEREEAYNHVIFVANALHDVLKKKYEV
ncbi:MAG: hypothetical protein Q4Q07_01595 [Tissierellia bacterium]|nr:hypothetical protein [Tissierellia bacterium]